MTIVGNGVWIRFMFRVLADDRPAGTVHAGPTAALRGSGMNPGVRAA